MNPSNGKGDKRRPEDNSKYRDEHERIFGARPLKKVTNLATGEIVYLEGRTNVIPKNS